MVIENAGEGIDEVVSYVSYTLPEHVELLELRGNAPLEGTGNDEANWILGNDADNVLRGAEGNDSLNGSGGDDTLEGGAGADRIRGDNGNDTYIIDEDDFVEEDFDAGNDWIVASFSYTLGNNFENLELRGGQDLTGTGNALDNQLIGSDGNNTLNGGLGNDTLSGGAGNDVLNGGDGDDTVVFAGTRENYTVIKNADGSFTVIDNRSGEDGEDALTGIEFIQFADSSLDLAAAANPPSDFKLAGNPDDVSITEGATEIGALTADQSGIAWSFDTTAENGGDAAGMFVIENGVIKLAPGKALEYDGPGAVHAYTIVVKATNELGVTSTHSFTINVANDTSDDNRAPTGISIANGTIAENASVGAEVAMLTGQDPNVGDTFTYEIVANAEGDPLPGGDTFFVIGTGEDSDKILLKAALDDAQVGTHDLWIKVTDAGGLSTVRKVTITVTNVNEDPTDVRLDGYSGEVVEGATIIGTLQADDEDRDSIAWSFDSTAEGGGDADGMFVIDENGRVSVAPGKSLEYDGEQAVRSYTIHVVASDGHGGETKKSFTINVANDPSDDNRDPTGLTLSIHLEESTEAVTIGTLSATDPDGDTLTYTLVDENGIAVSETSEFAIRTIMNGEEVTGYELVTKAGIRVTEDETRNVWVKASDGKGGATTQKFVIAIKDNKAPSIAVDAAKTVTSAVDNGLAVAPFTGVTFADGPENNELTVTITFATSEGELVVPATLPAGIIQQAPGSTAETRTYTFTGRAAALNTFIDSLAFNPTDRPAAAAGSKVTTAFTMTVSDSLNPQADVNTQIKVETIVANRAPTDINLSGASVQEGAATGTLIGLLSATDTNAGDSFTFSAVDDRFEVTKDGRLLVKDGARLDYETAQAHQIRVTVADKAGATYEKAFTIQIGDVVETQAGTKGNNALTGGIGSDKLLGGAGNDRLSGAAGDDTLSGGTGKDVLTGGDGRDIFVFDTKPNRSKNKDKIADFIVKDDSIHLENKVFTKLGKAGSPENPAQLKKAFFTVGSKAKDKNDYVIYDKAKGVLYYDADGSGAGKAVEIATLSKKLAMTYKDFFVI